MNVLCSLHSFFTPHFLRINCGLCVRIALKAIFKPVSYVVCIYLINYLIKSVCDETSRTSIEAHLPLICSM